MVEKRKYLIILLYLIQTENKNKVKYAEIKKITKEITKQYKNESRNTNRTAKESKYFQEKRKSTSKGD